MIPRRLRALSKIVFIRVSKGWGLYVRLLFCFAAGLTVLLATSQGTYDIRFSLRGIQPVGDDIVLINLSRDDVGWIGGFSDPTSSNFMWSLKEVVETSDSFFWQSNIWEAAVSKVKNAGAQTI